MKPKTLSLILVSAMIGCLLSGCGQVAEGKEKEVSVQSSTLDEVAEEASDEPAKSTGTESVENSTADTEKNSAANSSENLSEDEADDYKISESSSESSEVEASENAEGSLEIVEDSTELSEADAGAPLLLLHRVNKNEWNAKNIPYIKHYYSYLSLEKEYAASHSALAESLNEARDEIASHEYDSYTISKEEAQENDEYTFDSSWYTYLRRADSKYLSFVNECTNEGSFDFNRVSYIAHSYYVDSGKEIKLTDIVADEDAFYDLLSEKVKKNVDEVMTDYMGETLDIDKEKVKDIIKTCMECVECSWTLDPQGITFWLDSSVFSPFVISNTVFFSEDTEGKIFNEEFAKDVPDEWIMQMPEGDNTYFDEDDDGEENTIKAATIYDYNPEIENYYLDGFMISYEDDYQRYKENEASDYYFFLIHKDHKNLILDAHYEYENAVMNTYLLENGKIKKGDTAPAALEYSWDETADDEDNAPYYIPTGTDGIRVLVDEDNEAHDVKQDTLSVFMDGKLTLAGGGAEE